MTSLACANCGWPFESRKSRASHEQRGHPGWRPTPELLAERERERWNRNNAAQGAIRSQRYRQMHPERAIAAQRRYRAAHPDRVEASAAQYREAHRQEQRDRTRAWRQKPESTEKRRAVRQRQIAEGKHSARMAVQRAIKRGEITPEPCFRCGATPAEAHHYLGYVREHWLHVIWCCDLHHAQVHAALRRAADAAGSHVGMVT